MLNFFTAAALKNLRFFTFWALLVGLFPALSLVAVAQAAGSPDTTFSDDGIAATNFPTYNFSEGSRIALQSDNKVVLAGDVLRMMGKKGSVNHFAVARFNTDGTLDQNFGDGGRAFTTAIAGQQAHAIAIQPDGKIVVAGLSSDGGGNSDFGLVRFNPDGTPDTSFNGTGGVRTGFETPFSTTDVVEDIAVQPDGKIIAVGRVIHSPNPPTLAADFAAVRYNPDGSLDPTFGGFGKILFNLAPNLTNIAHGVALQPDGKIVISGYVQNGQGLVVRLNADGSLDSSFDGDGKAFISVAGITLSLGKIVLQPDNKIVITGTAYRQMPFVYDFATIRLNPDGSPDTNFGSGGAVITDFSGGRDDSGNALIQRNGKILVVGTTRSPSSSHIAMARYNANGTPDASFGAGGKIMTSFPNVAFEYASSAVLQPDGKIIAGGGSSVGGFSAFRFHGDLLSSQFSAFDYDGDGKGDISVFRPSVGDWYISRSSDGALGGTHFGANGDLIAPADFDRDGKTDYCVFRPSAGSWYRLNSSDNSFTAVQFGAAGDLPAPADFDGDARADISVYRPTAGSWYRLNSSNNQSIGIQFGIAEDKPIVGDFDGDGKADLTVFRPSNGTWYRINSSNNTFSPNQFGIAEDKPAAADYDGDGKTDLAVFRPSVGDWYIINSGNSSFTATHFGVSEDKPSPADYDGDGKADLVVFRPSNGTWYLLRTTAGFTGVQFGANEDIPTPNAFVR